MVERPMPYSLEAEESLLGNIMIYPDAMRQAVEAGLFGEDFYFDKHRKIFAIMYTMYEKKENIDSPADEVIIETSTEKKEKKSFWKRLFG